MTKPTPKHSRVPARRLRRAEPRHVRQAAVSFSTIGTLAVTVAGVAVVATSTYGFVPGPAAASVAPDGYRFAKSDGKPNYAILRNACSAAPLRIARKKAPQRVQIRFIAMLKLLFKSDRS